MIKVLVVDDSAFMRKVISEILQKDPEIEVIGKAANGKIALDLIEKFSPDVVTLDIEMPVMNGIETLRNIKKHKGISVVMISALTEGSSDHTIEALELGAVDFITKPDGPISLHLKDKELEIISKVKGAASAKHQGGFDIESSKITSFNPTNRKIVVFASSTGGPNTLEAILTVLPEGFPSPVVVVQHMPPIFTKSFSERLNRICQIPVCEAKDGEILKDGVIYIAPGDYHTEIEGNAANAFFKLNKNPKRESVRPCANYLFESAAKVFLDNTIGIVLTGMGKDGLDGSKKIKEVSGTILTEHEDDCVIYGMPKEVVDAGCYDAVVRLKKIPTYLVELVDV